MRTRTRRRARATERRVAAWGGVLLAATLGWSEAAARTLDVAVRDGLLSVEARDVPLGELLQAVADKAGFRLVMRERMGAPVTWSLRGVPVERGVARILGRASSVSLYVPVPGRRDQVLAELRVLRNAPEGVAMRVEHGTGDPAGWDGQVVAGFEPEPILAHEDPNDPVEGPSPAQLRQYALDGANVAPRDDDPVVRRKAAVGAARLRPEAAGTALGAALTDPDGVVRLRAVQGLARMGGEQAVGPLSRILLEDPDSRVRRMAASSLGRIDTESAFWALMEANSDDDPGVREAVAGALAGLERRGVKTQVTPAAGK